MTQIRFDGSVFARQLTGILDLLVLSLQQAAWREATGEAWLAGVARDVASVRERLEQPFAVLVLGDFKRGKSTLINALLRRALVTSDVAPETVAITEIHHGPELKVEAFLVNGGRVQLREDDLPSERLSPILDNLPAATDHIRIEAPLPALEGMTIVDSPGTGDLLWRFDARVLEYLPRADAVIHVVSVVSPLSSTERDFLSLGVRPLDHAKVVFVVNMVDQTRSSGDADRVVSRIAEGVRATFPDAPVLGVSALYELARATGEEVPDPSRAPQLARAFDELRALLERRVFLHRDLVRNERAVHSATRLVARSQADVDAMRTRLESGREVLRGQLLAARQGDAAARDDIARRAEQLRSDIRALGDEAAGWMLELVTRVERETLPALEAFGHDELKRHLPFFLGEVFRDGIGACLDAHQQRLMEAITTASPAAANALEGGLDLAGDALELAADRAGFHTPAWSMVDHLHVVGAVLTAVTGGLGAIVAGLVGAADHTVGRKARAEDFRASFAEALPRLRAEVPQATRSAYAQLGERIAAAVSQHQSAELEVLQRGLEQAVQLHDRGDKAVSDALGSLAQVRNRLAEALAELQSLRESLRDAAET